MKFVYCPQTKPQPNSHNSSDELHQCDIIHKWIVLDILIPTFIKTPPPPPEDKF